MYLNCLAFSNCKSLPGDDHIGIRLGEEVKVLEIAPGQSNHYTRLVLHSCYLLAGQTKQARGRRGGGWMLRQLTKLKPAFLCSSHNS